MKLLKIILLTILVYKIIKSIQDNTIVDLIESTTEFLILIIEIFSDYS